AGRSVHPAFPARQARTSACFDAESAMPTNPGFRGPKPPESKPNGRPGIGIFQMIGLGLFLLFVLFLVIVIVGSLFDT
ncbi:MAG: hypothetical protein ACYC5S_06275, partial [Thiobacillus sp.]